MGRKQFDGQKGNSKHVVGTESHIDRVDLVVYTRFCLRRWLTSFLRLDPSDGLTGAVVAVYIAGEAVG
jgi:hypothetical protein